MNVVIGRYRNYNKRLKVTPERKIKVRIDPWDTWSMDRTLAYIIHPMLVQLKATKHGAPYVEMEDVPEHLRSEVATDPVTFEPDEHWQTRWDWVLDEMIWAFAQILDDESDSQFRTGEIHHMWQPLDKDGKPIGEPREGSDRTTVEGAKDLRMVEGPNHTYQIDMVGLEAHYARINNGLRLFGVYYRGLWD